MPKKHKQERCIRNLELDTAYGNLVVVQEIRFFEVTRMSRGQTPLLRAAFILYRVLIVVGSPLALRMREHVLGRQIRQ